MSPSVLAWNFKLNDNSLAGVVEVESTSMIWKFDPVLQIVCVLSPAGSRLYAVIVWQLSVIVSDAYDWRVRLSAYSE